MSEPVAIQKINEAYDENILSAIGTLMLTAALSEAGLTLICIRLLSHPKAMQAALLYPIQGMEFRPKLHLINQVCGRKFKQHQKEVEKQCKKIERAYVKRNLFAHGVIDSAHQGSQLSISFIKNITYGHENKRQIVTADDILEYAETIQRRVYALDDLLTTAGVRIYELDPEDQPASSPPPD